MAGDDVRSRLTSSRWLGSVGDMDEPTADRIVKSRYTLARYKAMGIPPDSGQTLLRMFSEEVMFLRKVKLEQGADHLDPLIAEWEEMRQRVRRVAQ